MFWNIYWKRILSSLRSKDMIIWTWAFPIMLSTLFYFTLTNLDEESLLKIIPVGIVTDAAFEQDTTFQTIIDTVSEPGEDQLFDLHRVDNAEQGDALLLQGEIDGYIQFKNKTPDFITKNDGLNQTIIKSFLDNYLQTKSSMEKLMTENPSALHQAASLFSREAFTKEISLTENPPTDTVNFFYALLAMVCMYGGFLGLKSVSMLQANLSPLGARRTMSPVKRFRLITCDLLGCITVHFACLLVIVSYIVFVLGISFGSKSGLVILTCLAGSLLGVSFGALVSISAKLKEAAKTAVLIVTTMICCFLSGLMFSGINYLIAQKAPALSWLNPAARIVDAFYCLYYYDTYDRYFLNIGILLLMSLVMFTMTAFFLRRQRYESI